MLPRAGQVTVDSLERNLPLKGGGNLWCNSVMLRQSVQRYGYEFVVAPLRFQFTIKWCMSNDGLESTCSLLGIISASIKGVRILEWTSLLKLATELFTQRCNHIESHRPTGILYIYIYLPYSEIDGDIYIYIHLYKYYDIVHIWMRDFTC